MDLQGNPKRFPTNWHYPGMPPPANECCIWLTWNAWGRLCCTRAWRPAAGRVGGIQSVTERGGDRLRLSSFPSKTQPILALMLKIDILQSNSIFRRMHIEVGYEACYRFYCRFCRLVFLFKTLGRDRARPAFAWYHRAVYVMTGWNAGDRLSILSQQWRK